VKPKASQADRREQKIEHARHLVASYFDMFTVYILGLAVVAQLAGAPYTLPLASAAVFLALPAVTGNYLRSLGLADIAASLSTILLLYLSPPRAPPYAYAAEAVIVAIAASLGLAVLAGKTSKGDVSKLLYALLLAPALASPSSWYFAAAAAALALVGMAALSYLWNRWESCVAAVAVSLALASYLFAIGLYVAPTPGPLVNTLIGFAFIESFSLMPPLQLRGASGGL